MKILLVGGTGTIGKRIYWRLQEQHEIISAGSKSGDVQFDMTDPKSIEELFAQVGQVDALVVAAGGDGTVQHALSAEDELTVAVFGAYGAFVGLSLTRMFGDRGVRPLTIGAPIS